MTRRDSKLTRVVYALGDRLAGAFALAWLWVIVFVVADALRGDIVYRCGVLAMAAILGFVFAPTIFTDKGR